MGGCNLKKTKKHGHILFLVNIQLYFTLWIYLLHTVSRILAQ